LVSLDITVVAKFQWADESPVIPALQFLDRLADRGRGHAQALCGAGEVQFFGQREHHLDVLPFHPLGYPVVDSGAAG